MSKLRPDAAACTSPGDRMTLSAYARDKYLLAALLRVPCWRRGYLPARVEPSLEVSIGFCRHLEAHLRVLITTKLCALSPINSGLVCLKIKCCRIDRYQILFAVHVRHPEA